MLVMPVILPKAKEALWITRNIPRFDIERVLQPFDERGMSAHPVTRALNRPSVEPIGAKAIQEYQYPELPPLLTSPVC